MLSTSSCRVALYSHDTMGLGHMRRNLLLAQSLERSRLQAVVLIIAGAREASLVARTTGIDCVALPSLRKDERGQYHPRHLQVSLPELVTLRAQTTRAALEAFAPDVLIVDNVPRGALRELDPVLEWLHANRRTRLVLGLRDVLDDPITLRGEWGRARNLDAVRFYYDAIWVYGDPTVYDPVREYGFGPDVADKVRYTGYLGRRTRVGVAGTNGTDPAEALGLGPGRLALCLVGGGQDGAALAEAFMRADLPAATNGVVVTGPYMPPGARRRLGRHAARHPRRRVVRFMREPTRLLSRADRVVAMGGYNTICEVLSFSKPALIVPRTRPRREQFIRAEHLRELGLVDVLHPNDLTPAALSAWLGRRRHVRPARDLIDLNGVRRVPQLMEELLDGDFTAAPVKRLAAGVRRAE
jgi:predicted glycosyltransferase